jgi:hypothetical protein
MSTDIIIVNRKEYTYHKKPNINRDTYIDRENQLTRLSNENATLSDENAELQRMLQQAGIDIPSSNKK